MSKQYIGIDPSLNGTAVAIYDGTNHFTFKWEPSKEVQKHPVRRLAWLRDQLCSFLDATPRIEAVAIEGYSFSSQVSRSHAQGEWGGILRLKLFETLGPSKVVLVPPSNLKKFVTGKGNIGKDMILMKAFQQWGIEFSTHDEADAYGLARMVHAISINAKLFAYQQESIKKGLSWLD